MRLQHAHDLAAFLLRDQSWDRAEIESTIASGNTLEVALQRPVPLWVLYLTAFVDLGGAVHFRDDVYGIDARGRIFEELGAEAVEVVSRTAQRCLG
jgi:L,D-transpeptidase YcbB